MAERLRTSLLVVTLILVTVDVTIAVLGLGPRDGGRLPSMMVVRPGQAPVEWHGWQLIPPSGAGSCARDGYDSCGDSQGDDDDSLDPSDDNEPTSI